MFDVVPFTYPTITKSAVACLNALVKLIVSSDLISLPDCTKQAGYCCSDNSSTLKGSLVTFFKVIGDVPVQIAVTILDAISSRLLIIF